MNNTQSNLKEKLNQASSKKQDNKPAENGKVWSDLYGGYVPSLYAQGR